jgi:hypothetical protein
MIAVGGEDPLALAAEKLVALLVGAECVAGVARQFRLKIDACSRVSR